MSNFSNFSINNTLKHIFFEKNLYSKCFLFQVTFKKNEFRALKHISFEKYIHFFFNSTADMNKVNKIFAIPLFSVENALSLEL